MAPPELLDHWHLPLRHSRRRVNGVDLHVALGGSGPPLHLLHGSPKTMYGWRRLVPHLTPTTRWYCWASRQALSLHGADAVR